MEKDMKKDSKQNRVGDNPRTEVTNMVLSAMFIAIGIILPFFTGQVPRIGNMLLPMHIPVMLCGLICGWKYGLIAGIVTPLLRSFLFPAPILYPNAIAMALELGTYGGVAGFLYGKSKWKCVVSLYRSMLVSMVSGRLVWGLAMIVLLGVKGNAFTMEAFLAGAFLNAIPGIVIQLIAIPAIMMALHRTRMVPFTKKTKIPEHVKTDTRYQLLQVKRIVEKIDGMQKRPLLIAIDGRCASGKSTLAKALQEVLGSDKCNVVSMDHFFLQPHMRTEERLAEPGGNVDYERVLEEVIKPLAEGKDTPITYRPYQCKEQKMGPEIVLKQKDITIVEGAYSCHPTLTDYYDFRVFLTVEKEEQLRRLALRNGEEQVKVFQKKWIPMEEQYFESLKISEKCEIVM